MGDKHNSRAVLFLKIVHQVQNLRLNGHIQSRSGLVGNEELGFTSQGHGNHHTLAHTAGKLMGILLHHNLRVGDLHIRQHLHSRLSSLLLAHVTVDDEGLRKLPLHRKHRVQSRHRLLENHGDLIATDVVHLTHGNLG